MKANDKNLGMGRNISRRDLLHGLGALTASSLVPGNALADTVLASELKTPSAYPPSLTGLRGNHLGSYEVAHQLARGGKRDWGKENEADNTVYDLVVVGAGLSGLSAAFLFLSLNPNSSVLILDNHDDFGGHAKRNEFQIGSKTMLGYGGSQTLEEPSSYSDQVKSFLQELRIDLKQFDKAYDNDFFTRHGLGAGTFFSEKKWGKNKLVPYDIGGLGGTLPLSPSILTEKQAVQQIPISDVARQQLLGLLTEKNDRMPEIKAANKEDYLYSISYKEFLIKHIGITEPEVFKVLQDLSTDSCVGIETASAGTSILYVGLPGAAAAGLSDFDEDYEPYIHHFPDGNASIARTLVHRMIPDVAKDIKTEDILQSRFNYESLDSENSPVRLRLNSTVVNVEHEGQPKSAKTVRVRYVKAGQAYNIRAKHCVMACYNAMIPSICPELGNKQTEALSKQVKSPILYTNVVLNNWRAWKKLSIGAVSCPGSYHVSALMDFPVSMGGYSYTSNPDEPVIIHMERFPHRANEGLTKREQHRLGRHELLSTSYETIERNIREQLAGMLGEGGFDPAKDIEAITVNRWAHGYSYSYDWINEPYYDNWNDERYPHVQARKPWGRIAIANADSNAEASIESAISQAYRAIGELS